MGWSENAKNVVNNGDVFWMMDDRSSSARSVFSKIGSLLEPLPTILITVAKNE